MKWTNKLPEKPGWYWVRNHKYVKDSPASIVEVRMHKGRLAVDVYCSLENSQYNDSEFSDEPISEPQENDLG